MRESRAFLRRLKGLIRDNYGGRWENVNPAFSESQRPDFPRVYNAGRYGDGRTSCSSYGTRNVRWLTGKSGVIIRATRLRCRTATMWGKIGTTRVRNKLLRHGERSPPNRIRTSLWEAHSNESVSDDPPAGEGLQSLRAISIDGAEFFGPPGGGWSVGRVAPAAAGEVARSPNRLPICGGDEQRFRFTACVARGVFKSPSSRLRCGHDWCRSPSVEFRQRVRCGH